MPISRTEIMTTTWTRTWDMMERFSYAACQLRDVFRVELCRTWAAAKAAAALLARSAKDLWVEIVTLENKTRLDFHGREKLRMLQHAHDMAVARKKAAQTEADIAVKRDLIRAAASRFAAITFIKKDGGEHTMRVQPAKLKFQVKGDAACESAQRATQTRKDRHPHLLAVWDADKAAPRSVNLATVTRIAVDGIAHCFEVAA